MARPTATSHAAVVALLAALLPLTACSAAGSSAADLSSKLPGFGRGVPRIRAPSGERPPWLSPLPADPQRPPAPEGAFRA